MTSQNEPALLTKTENNSSLSLQDQILLKAKTYNLDFKFYKKFNKDLVMLFDETELANHFLNHGRAEGRFANPTELINALEKEHGPLPADFNSSVYQKLHGDLSNKTENWELCEHYIRYGRYEKRAYGSAFSIYDKEFRDLKDSDPGKVATQAYVESFPTFELMLLSAGLKLGSWLSQFMLYEFTLLNQDWLPYRPTSRMEGITLFVQSGVDRIAPISFAANFEPEFYRARAAKNMTAVSDADLFRDWLNRGFEAGEACCQADAVRRLIGTPTFPACFNEALYRSSLIGTTELIPPGRVAALEHFVTKGFADKDLNFRLKPVYEAAALLESIAEHHLASHNLETAKRAFDAALAHAPNNSRLLHRRGDTLKLLSHPHEATKDYKAAAEETGSILWSHIHAAEGLTDLPDGIEVALDRVLRSAARFNGDHRWRAAAHTVLDKVFAGAAAKANIFYRNGRRSDADAELTSMLDRLIEIIPIIDPLPARMPAPESGNIIIIANVDLPQCTYYRVEQKRRQLERGGWLVTIIEQKDIAQSLSKLNHAAAVIFYRVAAFRPILHAMLYARALGLQTIYEIDDLIFDAAHYPDPFESFEGQITEHDYIGLQYGVPLFRYAMQQCDIGLASTPTLAEAMRPLVRSNTCYVLRNGFDERNAPFLKRPQDENASEHLLTVFYGSGTKAHNKDFNDLATPALLHVLEFYDNVRVIIAGYLSLDERLVRYSNRILQIGFTENVGNYWNVLADSDINISVLKPTAMADAKSEIKWLEAAMCGVPSIVSDTRTYRELLTHGEDAMIASTSDEWRHALDHLINDPLLRKQIGERARARAIASYGIDAAVEVLAAILPSAPERDSISIKENWLSPQQPSNPRMPKRRKKPRILFVNVYFPPQAVGGATRVVQNNIDNFIDQVDDRFEFAIIAVDEHMPISDSSNVSYGSRFDSYRGIPVYRISAPLERDMIWRPFNTKMRTPFISFLEHFEPDLVHFHCVQRLTATVVEVVRERSIPYVVTVHDAWWISDFQFLIDENGIVQKPTSDPYSDSFDKSHSAIDSIARRVSLKRLLNGANDIFAVSDYFASVYREAGFIKTIAIPNGVPPMTVLPRNRPQTRHVHLGHIGGRTTHKGATLVEFVLRANSFSNLTLTLVDHSQDGGHQRHEIWGTTRVQIVGFIPQDEISKLYSSLDVLLAPSLWPESFGLVSREAKAAGLWVVASDRGAIGEEITEGVDGFRVNVDGSEQLTAVLAQINADPARFKSSPPISEKPIRYMHDQAQDLITYYAHLLGSP